MVNLKELNKFRKAQSQMQKELEQLFATEEHRGIRVTVRGDQKIESITIDNEEQKELKQVINSAMKSVLKKAQKQMRGQIQDLGIPGLS